MLTKEQEVEAVARVWNMGINSLDPDSTLYWKKY